MLHPERYVLADPDSQRQLSSPLWADRATSAADAYGRPWGTSAAHVMLAVEAVRRVVA